MTWVKSTVGTTGPEGRLDRALQAAPLGCGDRGESRGHGDRLLGLYNLGAVTCYGPWACFRSLMQSTSIYRVTATYHELCGMWVHFTKEHRV